MVVISQLLIAEKIYPRKPPGQDHVGCVDNSPR